jgi:hypothetical protein
VIIAIVAVVAAFGAILVTIVAVIVETDLHVPGGAFVFLLALLQSIQKEHVCLSGHAAPFDFFHKYRIIAILTTCIIVPVDFREAPPSAPKVWVKHIHAGGQTHHHYFRVQFLPSLVPLKVYICVGQSGHDSCDGMNVVWVHLFEDPQGLLLERQGFQLSSNGRTTRSHVDH